MWLVLQCLSLRRQLGRLRTMLSAAMRRDCRAVRGHYERTIQNQPPQCAGGNDGRGRKPYAWAQRLGNAGWREFAEPGQPALVAESRVWGCGTGAVFDDAGASAGRDMQTAGGDQPDVSRLAEDGPAAAQLSPDRRVDLERHALRRVGEAGLRVARPLQRRPLPLRGRAGLRGGRPRKAKTEEGDVG